MINAGLRSHVFKSIVHQNFDGETFANNIALLILESQLKFSRRIFPICFPDQGIVPEEVGSIVGFRNKNFAGVLGEVELPIVDESECLENDLNVGEKSFCAGRKGEVENVCRSYLGEFRSYNAFTVLTTISQVVACILRVANCGV